MGESVESSGFELIPPEEFKMQQSDIVEKTDYEKAVDADNFWDMLYSDTARLKADTNQDHKISYEEYRDYILSQEVVLPVSPTIETHVYKLDYSFYIVFGMVCVTSIIIAWIKNRRAP